MGVRGFTYWLAVVLLGPAGAGAQDSPGPARPVPGPLIPPPDFARAMARGTRSQTGEPGPAYWQQETRYRLRARLDVTAMRLEGQAEIWYANRSPDTLRVIALHLHQNLHAPGVMRNEAQEVTGGVDLRAVRAGGQTLASGRGTPGFAVDGTILRIRPATPVPPGDSVQLDVLWNFAIPQSGAGRMGWSRDDLFFLAYWYPQLAVYDDIAGWHVDPYLGSAEFYAGFGTYEVEIEAPPGWVVMATGDLVNAAAVLSRPVQDRLRVAERSDTVVNVITPQMAREGGVTAPGTAGWLSWRFAAQRVRDVAFSATRGGLWDAARTPVGDPDGDGQGDYARVDALYRADAPLWRHAARYAQHSIAALSRFTGLPYPWSHMSAVEGAGIIGGGMEFPMMTLIGSYTGRTDSALYYVTAHELAHMWVPMTVSTDERRYGWMDEGTTTFNENQIRKEFFPGPDHEAGDRREYLAAARSGYESEMMRWTDYLYPGQNGIASYSKPATVLATLRGLLGDSVFLAAYRTYLSRWAFKHPKPWDFFHTFNHVSGRNLDWFWQTWYFETWTLDHAVGAVDMGPGGTRVVVEDRGWAPMPTRLAATRSSGEVVRREVPVEHWLRGARTAEVVIPAGAEVVRVELDPEGVFPDVDRTNNVWERSAIRRQ
ncbi:MAG TPA: M1 family metallopeptidase [Gemmatimonadales bacterium]|nr:M1 family metallopeptidase [Gemmatimonadales bacterium]